MKQRFFYILLLLFAFCSFAMAETSENIIDFAIEEEVLEEIWLDGQSYESLNINIRGKVIEPDDLALNFDENYHYKYNSLLSTESPLYREQKFSYGQEKEFLGVKFGVNYDNKVARGDFEQLRTLYAEYERDRFSVRTSYRANAFALVNKDNSYRLQFAPKYKINDCIALKYVHSDTDEEFERDILFSLTPTGDDRFNLDFGIGGKKPLNDEPASARFLFSTGVSF